MDERSWYQRSRDGLELDDTTSTPVEDPRWRYIMRHGVMGLIISVTLDISLVVVVRVLIRKLLSSSISIATFVIFVNSFLSALPYAYIYIFVMRRELLRRLHREFRAWHARACVGMFNWENACATFVKELAIRTTNRRNDGLKHFKWTCVSPHILGRVESVCCEA